MLPCQEHPLALDFFKRYFCYFFYFGNYENLHVSSDNQRVNTARLISTSSVPLLCRAGHYYSRGTTSILAAYSLSHTHLHTYAISKSPFFKMLAVLNLSRRLQTCLHLLKWNIAHNVLLWRHWNRGYEQPSGSKPDPSNNTTASLKQNYLILYTLRCCTVQSSALFL